MSQTPIGTRVVFARVGWMDFYNGTYSERPKGGGKYNQGEIGHEAYNFKVVKDMLYGYFQPQMAASSVRLDRILAGATGSDLSDVLVIFVATWPQGSLRQGQVIVGWYGDATVYRTAQKAAPGRPSAEFGYFCKSAAAKAVLLPPANRTCAIPSGKGGIGRANICYPLTTGGTPKSEPWITHAISFVTQYEGPNLLIDTLADIEPNVANLVENARRRAEGQGYGLSAKERAAVEALAMQAAAMHFSQQGYQVDDVSRHKPYDLVCKNGIEELHVEVKGTTTSGKSVFLTPAERKHAEHTLSVPVLFVLHSVKRTGSKAEGGSICILHPWKLDPHQLKPTGYEYLVMAQG
jgi:hypothetical protein